MNMKKLIAKKKEKIDELRTKIKELSDPNEIRTAYSLIEELNEEIQMLESRDQELITESNKEKAIEEDRGKNPIGNLKGIEPKKTPENRNDVFGSVEYREAFKDFVQRGIRIPEQFRSEMRSDTYSSASYLGSVIPTTIANEILREMKVYGQLYARVRKTNVPAGLQFPVSNLIPTAEWITEGSPSERKRMDIDQKVTFSYYGLECKLATSLLASIVSLPMFETEITSLLGEAFGKALDYAIVRGDGSGEPLGIAIDSGVPTAITMTSDQMSTWTDWKTRIFAQMPLAYKKGSILIVANGTFETYVDGMVDANGNPIARYISGVEGDPITRFNGREVVLVEDDIIGNFDDASSGDVIGILADLGRYAINSNLQYSYRKYTDEDLNQIVDKGIMIADGKLLLKNSALVIKKA
jgi:HK97 family phage major capsid protein